jgi:hypothetical protein
MQGIILLSNSSPSTVDKIFDATPEEYRKAVVDAYTPRWEKFKQENPTLANLISARFGPFQGRSNVTIEKGKSEVIEGSRFINDMGPKQDARPYLGPLSMREGDLEDNSRVAMPASDVPLNQMVGGALNQQAAPPAEATPVQPAPAPEQITIPSADVLRKTGIEGGENGVMEAGIIASRRVPAIQAMENVAEKSPDKVSASPIAPRMAEKLKEIGQNVRTTMESLVDSAGLSPFDSKRRKAWRDTQIYAENLKANDFMNSFRMSMENADKIFRNPKGQEESWQDYLSFMTGGKEGFAQKRQVQVAMDQLVATINQYAATNGLKLLELQLDDQYKRALLASKEMTEKVPPGVPSALWKMVLESHTDIMKRLNDPKTGEPSDNKLIKILQERDNKQMWDFYNTVQYRMMGGTGNLQSVDFKRWRLMDFARNIAISLVPNTPLGARAYMKNYGTASKIPVTDFFGTGEPQDMQNVSFDEDTKALMKSLGLSYGLGKKGGEQ